MNKPVKRYDLTLKTLSDNLDKVVAPILSTAPLFFLIMSLSVLGSLFALFLCIDYVSFLILDNGFKDAIKDEADNFKETFAEHLEMRKALEKQIQVNEKKIKVLTTENIETKERVETLVRNSLANAMISGENTSLEQP
ncbi:MAG: hypothetical protein PHX27_04840, partial [Candidatus ainarchaeum sp.]|nr:hypothetical protein [Candidatus ainarchaeum sp.]